MTFPDYLHVAPNDLGKGTPVRVNIGEDMPQLAKHLAQVMLEEIIDAEKKGHPATFIVPVGPVDQYPILADMLNTSGRSICDVCLINMDEYLTDDDQWIDEKHPLSFRGYMQRLFYDRLPSALAPREENRLFPHSKHLDSIQKVIEKRGGVDVCFGGIGINGHIAFNEPPELNEKITDAEFAALPTRNLSLTRETRTINSVTVGGEISVIPHRAVTVGMKECLAARKMRFYCNRPWQGAVVRRVLHGPITRFCPASFLRTHADASITVASYVAAPPNIALR